MAPRRFHRIVGSALLLTFLAAAAAANFPPSDAAVNDTADLLSQGEMQALTAATRGAMQQYGIEVVVVIIDRVDAYDPKGPIEPFARALFDQLGIGDPERNDGVLVLLAFGDRNLAPAAGSECAD